MSHLKHSLMLLQQLCKKSSSYLSYRIVRRKKRERVGRGKEIEKRIVMLVYKSIAHSINFIPG